MGTIGLSSRDPPWTRKGLIFPEVGGHWKTFGRERQTWFQKGRCLTPLPRGVETTLFVLVVVKVFATICRSG